jgi:cation diffusion facilitator family transporter
MNRSSLTRYAWLSIAAAIITIFLKAVAYWLTGSVGLLSDALESTVNLVGAVVALVMLTIASRPPDELHEYGYSKAEYFSSGVEGGLIVLAAVSIAVAAIRRLISPVGIEQAGIGLLISALASILNFAVAQVLLRAGRANNSITLEADARHLMTDVWTSAGVIVGVGIVALTHFQILDPIIALLLAANIVFTGVNLVQRSALGLLDRALPPEEEKLLEDIFQKYSSEGVEFHALRTRQAGARGFVSVHILVPGGWSVLKGHQLLEKIESDVHQALPEVSIFTHLEPLNDPASFADTGLDRRP